jgi:hypothetical protein
MHCFALCHCVVALCCTSIFSSVWAPRVSHVDVVVIMMDAVVFFVRQWLVDSFPGTDVDGWSWCYPYMSLYVHLVVGWYLTVGTDLPHTARYVSERVLCRVVDV